MGDRKARTGRMEQGAGEQNRIQCGSEWSCRWEQTYPLLRIQIVELSEKRCPLLPPAGHSSTLTPTSTSSTHASLPLSLYILSLRLLSTFLYILPLFIRFPFHSSYHGAQLLTLYSALSRQVFMDILPPLLLMRVPKKEESRPSSLQDLPGAARPRPENGSGTTLRDRFRDRPHRYPGEPTEREKEKKQGKEKQKLGKRTRERKEDAWRRGIGKSGAEKGTWKGK